MPDRSPAGPPPAWWLSASTYAAIGIVGLLLFAIALYRAALPGVPAAGLFRLGLAVAGGGLAMLGLGRWNVLRRYPGGGRNRPKPKPPEAPPIYQSYRPPPRDEETPRRRVAPPFDPYRFGAVSRSRRSAIALAVTAFALVGFVLAGLPLPAAAAPATSGPPASAHGASATPPAGGRAPGPSLAGSITCIAGLYPVYTSINGLFPPLPKYSKQTPCKISHDEIHASFSSPAPGSGDQVEFPVVLPGSGVDAPAGTYADVYLGMVVKGDPNSVDGQSYASAVFQPVTEANGTTDWNLWVAIWSLELNTTCVSGVNFTWLGYYGCVLNDVGSGNGDELVHGIVGNTSANVTLVGSPSQSSRPFAIYFNDSSDPNASVNWTATAKATGTYLFQPYYPAACPDACLLNWSMPFGLGEGVDLCDWTGCFSYNATTQVGTPPFEVGAPKFWTGLAYSGTYLYVSLESTTGACGAVGGVPPCDPYAEAGIYPSVTFNGTALEVAGNYSFATEDFGGATHEFNGYATSTDFLPLFLDELTNSSRVGYLAPGLPLNVSVRAQSLGVVRWVNLSYQVPGGKLTNTSMALVAGTNESGTYAGAVPAVGGNGTVAFRVTATDAAGGTISLPPTGEPSATVNRTTVPTATIGVAVTPATCGHLVLNGVPFTNGSITKLLAGAYSLDATGCYPYAFTGWTTTGGLSIVGSGPSVVLDARGNGTVAAGFAYYHPIDTVTLAFEPTTCGAIGLNGTVYPATGSPEPVGLRDGGTYNLSVASCGGKSFSGWTVSNSANLSILGPLLFLHGNGTITATFVPTSTSYPVLFGTSPSTCGGVRLDEVGYTDGESVNLLAGTGYPIGPDPCAGYGYAPGNVSTSGLVTVNGGGLSVAGAGSVTYSYYKLTLVDVVTNPSTCGGIDWDGVLEPGGTMLNVTNHTVHTIGGAPCAGYYLEGLSVSGALALEGTTVTVNGPGSILASFRPGTEEFFVGFITAPTGCGSVVFDGTSYVNSEYSDVLPDTVHTLRASPCPGYGFVNWVVSGGIAIANGLAYVNQSGSIEAVFHPLVGVSFETDPTDCGSIVVDGVPYTNGTSALLPENAVYTIAADPCAHFVLSAWVAGGGATIANGTLVLNATAILDAQFVPALYAVTLTIEPASCGVVTIGAISYTNGSTLNLSAGVYPVAWTLCVGFALVSWATTGGLSLSGTSLAVTGPGNLTEVLGPIPPTVAIAAPTTTASGLATYFSATVGVLVPPYNYTFDWNFGDGTTASTPSNFTSHTYSTPGTYRVSVTVHDPYGRVATAWANVTAVAGASGPSFAIGTTGLLVIGLAAALLVVGLFVALWRARTASRGAPEPVSAPLEGRP